jgi:hypothetical protein
METKVTVCSLLYPLSRRSCDISLVMCDVFVQRAAQVEQLARSGIEEGVYLDLVAMHAV